MIDDVASAVNQDVTLLNTRGFNMRLMTWRALSMSPHRWVYDEQNPFDIMRRLTFMKRFAYKVRRCRLTLDVYGYRVKCIRT